MSYVETYDEHQLIQFLFETDDGREKFSTARTIVDQVLANTNTNNNNNNNNNNNSTRDDTTTVSPLLVRLLDIKQKETTTFDDLFQPLYGPIINHGEGQQSVPRQPLEMFQYQAAEKRRNFQLHVAYRGGDFCGWQRQPNYQGLPSVQQTVEEWLEVLQQGTAAATAATAAARRVDVRVCGRTDAGVHAIGQVCRFRSLLPLEAQEVFDHLEKIPSDSLRCHSVARVSKSFHPTFGATCRGYVYLIDTQQEQQQQQQQDDYGTWEQQCTKEQVDLLSTLLEQLQGRELDYYGLSYGKLKTQNSLCTLHHARACLVQTSSSSGNTTGSLPQQPQQAICIELVGDRFLRRMVRILVSTALSLVLQKETPAPDALLTIIQQQDRLLTSKAAPPDGLIFVGARFE
jgi:tRNA pseudouridine38-40 synthase